MNNSIVIVCFVSLTTYVLITSAQLPAATWSNPYFFYHYNAPLALSPQKVSAKGMAEINKQFSVDDQVIPNTLESHVILMSTCVRELKNTKAELAQTRQRFDETYAVVESVKEELKGNSKLLADVMATVENLKKGIDERTSDIVDIGRMPTSCEDLQQIGNKKNGFFSIMGQNKIQTVHCNFTRQPNDPNFQSLIGYVDVKSSPVYFHAQKTATYTNVGTVIPFERFRLNVGNAINSTGVFVAPKSGIYFFSFSAISNSNIIGRVDLQMKNATSDWFKIAQAFGQVTHETLTLQSTLQLAEGDQIRLIMREGAIHEQNDVQLLGPWTHFVGCLMEEDIF